MKKLYSLFLLLIGLICFTSCGDDDYAYTAPKHWMLQKRICTLNHRVAQEALR